MEEKWTTVWGHIEDLRKTLIQSLIIIGVGFVFLLGFYQPLLKLLPSFPIESSSNEMITRSLERKQIVNQSSRNRLFLLPQNALVPSGEIPAIREGSFIYYRLSPGQSLIYEIQSPPSFLILGPLEGVLLVVKICFWLSIVVTAPFWGWVWLKFILPGVKKEEKIILFPFLTLSIISLFAGLMFAYFVTAPLANQYLSSFNMSIGQNSWTLSYYVEYLFFIALGHAIAAEMGLFLLILVHFRVLTEKWLKEKRRLMIVLIFIFSAIMTPPDILTQLLMAIPLIFLYECAILYAKKRRFTLPLHE